MKNYIDAAVSRARTTLSVFVAIMITGFACYLAIPAELNPDVEVPIVITTIIHQGISPEDAERLLAKPSELELKTVDGITSVSSFSSENAATIITEFDIDFESQFALSEVREAINRAKARFPADTEEPLIQEVSAATLPVVQIAVGGNGVPERVLLQVAEELQREIEILPTILEAEMVGNREQLLEAVIDPAKLETYGISNASIIQTVTSNNRLIPAGQVDTGQGSFLHKGSRADRECRRPVQSATRIECRWRSDRIRYCGCKTHFQRRYALLLCEWFSLNLIERNEA